MLRRVFDLRWSLAGMEGPAVWPSPDFAPFAPMGLPGPAVYAIVIHMNRPSSTSVLSVRVSGEERTLLEAASEQARTSLSDFVRRKALEAAEINVLERSVVTIPAKHWAAFESWIARPAEPIPALKRLGRKTPTWQR